MARGRLPATLGLTCLVALGAAGAGLAATPKGGGTYTGQDSKEVKLVLKVSGNRKTGKADLFCSGSHQSATPTFAITHGSFYAVRKTGSTKLYSIKGRFISSTQAKVTASLKAVCAGGNHALTLDLAP